MANQIDLTLRCQLIVAAILAKYVSRIAFDFCGSQATVINDKELRQRLFYLCEHILFAIAGYYVIITLPGEQSWYTQPKLCWEYPPTIPSEAFHMFYIAKLGTHLEDVLVRIYQMLNYNRQLIINEQSNNNTDKQKQLKEHQPDLMMDIHHIATALLCILSYISGYFHIGSLLMLIHDISDVPLDFLRVFMTLKWEIFMYIAYAFTLVLWCYYRIYYLSSVLLYTVIYDPTTSFIYPCPNGFENPDCRVGLYAEMSVYVGFIGLLWILHIIWFIKMIGKGYRLLCSSSSVSSISSGNCNSS